MPRRLPRLRAGRPKRHRLALRVRAMIAFGLTALLLSVSLAALAFGLVRENLLDERASNAMREGYANARVLRRPLGERDPKVAPLLSSLSAGTSSAAVLHFRGEWFSSSVAAGRDAVPAALRDLVEDGHAGRQRYRLDGEVTLAVGVPIPAVDAAYFQVTSLDDLDHTFDLLARSLTVAGLVATVIGAAVGASASGAVLRPVRRMAGVAQRIVDGELESRLDAEGDTDLAPLVDSFNEMLDELRDRIHREARFASDVTHELRGPLAALAAAVSVVNRRREELPQPVLEAVDALDRHVNSFNQLVLGLLEISRFDAGVARLDLENLDLKAFLRVVLDERDLTEVPIRIEADGVVRVAADPRRLQQMVSNLVENAERYAGGVVDVSVTSAPDAVRIAVEDAGPGVPPDEREKIFDRLERGSLADAPDSPRGTGLGLALVAEHARLHGGRAWVEDREGGGSRFVLELPRPR